jgi:hypothetical protein
MKYIYKVGICCLAAILLSCQSDDKQSDQKETSKETINQSEPDNPEEAIKTFLHSYYEAMSARDIEKVIDFLADDIVYLSFPPSKERALKHIQKTFDNVDEGWMKIESIEFSQIEKGHYEVKVFEHINIAFPSPAKGWFDIRFIDGTYKIKEYKDISEELEED